MRSFLTFVLNLRFQRYGYKNWNLEKHICDDSHIHGYLCGI